MKNIETFELYCMDEDLELNIKNFDYFSKLKKVDIKIMEYLVYEYIEQIPIWKGEKDNLEITLDK